MKGIPFEEFVEIPDEMNKNGSFGAIAKYKWKNRDKTVVLKKAFISTCFYYLKSNIIII